MFPLDQHTIFLALAGSQAHGTAREGSDVDLRGVCIAPLALRLSLYQRFEQYEGGLPEALARSVFPRIQQRPTLARALAVKTECVIFDIAKFVELCAAANPNTLEILFTDERDWLLETPAWRRLHGERRRFLSKTVQQTFLGYALAQLKQIKTHRSWLLNPPTTKPAREDFGLPSALGTLSRDDQNRIEQSIADKIRSYGIDNVDMPKPARVLVQERMDAFYRDALAATEADLSDRLRAVATHALQLPAGVVAALNAEKKYRSAMKHWDSYQTWLSQRNAARAELEAKFGYDCYLDDTEFLTERGWKRYDEIGEDRLATLNQETAELEFQYATERVAKAYDGDILFVETRETSCAVTPNHRMWVSPVRRSPANGFSTRYSSNKAQWQIKRAADLTTGGRLSHHARVAAAGAADALSVSESMLALVGAYVSEGCVGKRARGAPAVLRFSQRAGGRLEKFMEIASRDFRLRRYEYDRRERKKPCREVVWTFADRKLAKSIAEECGEGSATKRLPRWVLRLARKDARFLLDALIAGDGTERKHSRTYYTASRQLADDIQALCVVAGVASMRWGPYDYGGPSKPMYQVYVGTKETTYVVGRGRASHVSTERMQGRRIVCFTVPNETLITRRSGKVAIQGNTKHAMHLVRLMRMGIELLETGDLRVRRDDAEELVAIRGGALSFDALSSHADGMRAKMDAAAQGSPLPDAVDHEAIDDLARVLVIGANLG